MRPLPKLPVDLTIPFLPPSSFCCCFTAPKSSKHTLLNHRPHLPENQVGYCKPPLCFPNQFQRLIPSTATEHQCSFPYLSADISCKSSHHSLMTSFSIYCFVLDPNSLLTQGPYVQGQKAGLKAHPHLHYCSLDSNPQASLALEDETGFPFLP